MRKKHYRDDKCCKRDSTGKPRFSIARVHGLHGSEKRPQEGQNDQEKERIFMEHRNRHKQLELRQNRDTTSKHLCRNRISTPCSISVTGSQIPIRIWAALRSG